MRFQDVKNVGELEQDLNKIRIGKAKLHNNIARFKKDEWKGKACTQVGGITHDTPKTRAVWKKKTNYQTYAHALQGLTTTTNNPKEEWNGI